MATNNKFSFLLLLCFLYWTGMAGQHQQQPEEEEIFLEQITGLHAKHKISALIIDDNDHKYVGTQVGLFRVRAVSNVIDTLLSGEAILSLAWHKRTGLWAGLEDGKIRNVETGEEIRMEEPGVRITCMAAGSNVIWVGTNMGVYTVSTTQARITDHFTSANSKLESDKINAIYWGPYNTTWIGTDQGVLRVFGDKWQVYEKEHRFVGITENSEGVWLASDDEMWLVYQKNRWAPVDAGEGLLKGDLRAIASDRKGNLYIASEMLTRFNPYENVIDSVDISGEFLEGATFAMLHDASDELWLASSNQGLVNLRRGPATAELSAVVIVEREPACADAATGIAEVQVAGGQRPYTYSWMPGDFNQAREEHLTAGSYEITVTDAAGATYYLQTALSAPPPIEISVLDSKAPGSRESKDGSAEIEVTGGIAPYTITWDSGEAESIAKKLSGGMHTVTVTDANQCEQVAEVSIGQGKILAALDINKINIGQTLRIEKLFFEADSTDIEPESYEILEEIRTFLDENEDVVIEIAGHTNNLPDHAYCDKLSLERAKSVAEYLYDRGIRENRIQAKGYGKRNPIASNATVEGRARNQRVEIRILSLGGE